MAEKVHDDLERDRRVKIIGDLFLNTGLSTRNISRLISNDNSYNFKISNATVSDYIQRYRAMNEDKAEQIDSLIEANKGSSVKNPEVIKRVYKVAELVMQNYSIEDIAKLLKQKYWVIYYDIDIRLRKINSNVYENIKLLLENHARGHSTNKDK